MSMVTKCAGCGMPTVSTGETEYQRGKRAGLEEAAEAVRAGCGACGGSGVAGMSGGGTVNHEMAMDAGEPDMAGMHIEGDPEECEYCGRPISAIRARIGNEES